MRRITAFGTAALLALLLSSPAGAQDDELPRFEEITIKEVSPEDLAGGVTVESPNKVVRKPLAMPTPPRDDVLEATRQRLVGRVVQIVAVRTPPQPYEQIPTLTRGHGVWLSLKAGGADPVLVTTRDWLEGAQTIYLVPPDELPEEDASARQPTQRRLIDVTAGRKDERALERAREDYAPLQLEHADRWRNLAALAPKTAAGRELAPPAGLALFDTEDEPLSHLYGFTPLRPDHMEPATILPEKAKEEALAFYFQTSWPVILGAPLVAADGRVVVLNALRHPEEPARALAIPPGALREFVAARQGVEPR